jgi:hypothetical protein
VPKDDGTEQEETIEQEKSEEEVIKDTDREEEAEVSVIKTKAVLGDTELQCFLQYNCGCSCLAYKVIFWNKRGIKVPMDKSVIQFLMMQNGVLREALEKSQSTINQMLADRLVTEALAVKISKVRRKQDNFVSKEECRDRISSAGSCWRTRARCG